MKLIKRKTHGYLDYLVGALLIAAPFLLDFNRGGAETLVPVILGAMTIVYSLLTDYELGAAKVIPFNVHIIIDILSGIVLAASPWLFNFADYVKTPHVVVGILEIVIAVVTDKSRATQTGQSNFKTGSFATH